MTRSLAQMQIIGHHLVAIRQTVAINDKGLDWAITYFVLDSGFAFCLPGEWAEGFETEEVPNVAEVIEHSRSNHVYCQPIIAVLRSGPDSDVFHDSPYLLLQNGYAVTDSMAAHHGTGGIGVLIFAPGEFDPSKLVPFWNTISPA